MLWWKKIGGTDYLVDPVAVRSDVDVLTENERDCVCIQTEEFGKVLFVAIGAAEVGTVKYVSIQSIRYPSSMP